MEAVAEKAMMSSQLALYQSDLAHASKHKAISSFVPRSRRSGTVYAKVLSSLKHMISQHTKSLAPYGASANLTMLSRIF